MDSSTRKQSNPRTRFAQLNGLWRSHDYGILLEIGADHYRLYEETQISCLCVFEGPLQELEDFYVDARVSPQRRAFGARRATGVTRVRFRRLSSLPDRCARRDRPARDPVHNFDVFWQTFAERYALFEIRGVNWHSIHHTYRSQVGASTGEKRLFETFVEMLQPLRDGHVELCAPFRRYTPAGPSPLQQRLAAELGKAHHHFEVATLLAEVRKRLRRTVRQHYVKAGTRRSCNGLLEWGRLNDATGYLAIHAMAGQSGRLDRPRDDQHAAAAGIERAFRDLADLPAMVVDVRDNGGGYDGVSLRIAGHFIDRKRLAFVKTASKREGYSGQQSVHVEPRPRKRYTGRVFLLTSGLTASAAEIFVLCLLEHPRVTRIGEPTRGELSDVMERRLPNGWSFTLSNELYRASDGELYEDVGIPPHVEIPFPHRRDLARGRDPMLDYALRQAGPPD